MVSLTLKITLKKCSEGIATRKIRKHGDINVILKKIGDSPKSLPESVVQGRFGTSVIKTSSIYGIQN